MLARSRVSRLNALLAAAVSLSFVVSACSSGGAPAPTSAPAAPAATAPAAASPAAKAAAGAVAGSPAKVIAEAPAAKLQGSEIKLGLITVTEGSPFAANGKAAQDGARFAVDEINAAGGIGGVKLRLVETDTRGNVNAVADLVRRLATQDNVLGIVGPLLSGECRIGCALSNELKVPLISPGAAQSGLMADARPYGFRLVMPDDVNSRPVVLEIIKRKNIKTAAIIMDEKEAIAKFMGENFWPRVLKEGGVKILTENDPVTFTSGESSFAAQVTKLKSMNPDAVALAAGTADAARIAQEIRRQGLKTQLIGSGGLQSSGEELIKAGGQGVEGLMAASQFNPDTADPDIHALIANYLAKTKTTQLASNAAYAYDAVYLFADMIKKQGVTNDPSKLQEDRDKIKDGLPKVKDWKGMGGGTTLGDNGEVQRPLMIATVQGGKFVIEEVKP